jgi:hypothetical protein
MTDLLKLLRNRYWPKYEIGNDLCAEAADELERLTARLADTEANLERLQQRWATRPATEELEARLAEAELIIDAHARFFWACEGPNHVLWSQCVNFLGDKYTGYERERATDSASVCTCAPWIVNGETRHEPSCAASTVTGVPTDAALKEGE